MATGLSQDWRILRRAPPGRRFEQYYRSARGRRERGRLWLRVARLAGGVACLAVGIVLVFIPGPAILFFLLAAAAFAAESLAAARLLDGAELRIRAWARRGRGAWRRLSGAGRIGAVVVTLALAGATVYAACRILIR